MDISLMPCQKLVKAIILQHIKDTVIPFNPETKEGTGITFQSFNAYDMLDAIKRAIDIYNNKPAWRVLRKNAMSVDYSWEKGAKQYIEIYKEILSR